MQQGVATTLTDTPVAFTLKNITPISTLTFFQYLQYLLLTAT